MNGDGIDQAIARTTAQRRAVVQHRFASGRMFAIDLPADLTVDEFRSLIGFVAVDLGPELARITSPKSIEPVADIVAERRARRQASDA